MKANKWDRKVIKVLTLVCRVLSLAFLFSQLAFASSPSPLCKTSLDETSPTSSDSNAQARAEITDFIDAIFARLAASGVSVPDEEKSLLRDIALNLDSQNRYVIMSDHYSFGDIGSNTTYFSHLNSIDELISTSTSPMVYSVLAADEISHQAHPLGFILLPSLGADPNHDKLEYNLAMAAHEYGHVLYRTHLVRTLLAENMRAQTKLLRILPIIFNRIFPPLQREIKSLLKQMELKYAEAGGDRSRFEEVEPEIKSIREKIDTIQKTRDSIDQVFEDVSKDLGFDPSLYSFDGPYQELLSDLVPIALTGYKIRNFDEELDVATWNQSDVHIELLPVATFLWHQYFVKENNLEKRFQLLIQVLDVIVQEVLELKDSEGNLRDLSIAEKNQSLIKRIRDSIPEIQ